MLHSGQVWLSDTLDLWSRPRGGDIKYRTFFNSTCNSITDTCLWLSRKGVLINLLCYLTRSHGTTLFFRLLSPTCLGLTDIEVMLKVVCICYLFAGGASKVSNKYLFCFLSSGELVLKPPSTSNHIIFSSQHLYLTYKTRILLKDRISELFEIY